MLIGNREFDTDKTYIMGIMNVTPDSFWSGSRAADTDKALFAAESMIKNGADIIDIGGESTRPGFEPVTAKEEISRLIPVISAVRSRFDIPVSADTYKGETALAALEAGADMINDVCALGHDDMMARVIADAGVPVCIMHNEKCTGDTVSSVISGLRKSIAKAEAAGIDKKKLIADPGIGFCKTKPQDLELIARLRELKALGLPLLLGASRKSVIGYALGLETEERAEATAALSVIAAMAGAMFVRVHDIKINRREIDMTAAVLRYAQ